MMEFLLKIILVTAVQFATKILFKDQILKIIYRPMVFRMTQFSVVMIVDLPAPLLRFIVIFQLSTKHQNSPLNAFAARNWCIVMMQKMAFKKLESIQLEKVKENCTSRNSLKLMKNWNKLFKTSLGIIWISSKFISSKGYNSFTGNTQPQIS